jgi:hypothetical protein
MYSTCLYCKANLGANEAVEAFPVGRRLAFDSAKGRLWVICQRCSRWNLSPLEERWEATEQCERHFHSTRRQVSTENIGLARIAEGVDLIRVGRPQRPEFAAWRYGSQLLRRRRRHRVEQFAKQGLGLSLWAGAVPFLWPIVLPLMAYDLYRSRQVVARIPGTQNELLGVSPKQARAVRLVPSDSSEGWALRVKHGSGVTDLTGPEALRMAGLVLPHVNREGAAAEQVDTAVTELERAGGADAYFMTVARRLDREKDFGPFSANDHRVGKAPLEIRLALEMAAHEQAEQRALEGELHVLEQAWKEAEEIAAIADSLLLPAPINEMLHRLRHRSGTPASETDRTERRT